VWEHYALGRVSSTNLGPTSKHCIKLLAQFTQPGQAEDGEHLCFVTEVLGGDVKSLQLQGQEENRTPLPLPLAKRILLHTLRGLAHLHGRGIVHTDLKSDNIMFDSGPLSTEDIAALVAADPPRRNPPEHSWQCIIQSAVNQPLPVPSLSEAMARTYLIADLGSGKQGRSILWGNKTDESCILAQPINAHSVDEITPVDLRAPETILRGPWNEKVDIWTFGCLVCHVLFVHSQAH
jgi:serine/threonine protein kinase